MKRRLTVVPQPDPESGRMIVRVAEGGLKGDGPLDLLCGVCDEVLAAGVPDSGLHHLAAALQREFIGKGGVGVRSEREPVILRCPNCGAYNEAR